METLSISGILAVSDQYGRLRLLIEDQSEVNLLQNYIKNITTKYIKLPYEFNKEKYLDGILMTCTITIKKHKEFWEKKIKDNRGQKINVKVKGRKWVMGGQSGISLDLIELESH